MGVTWWKNKIHHFLTLLWYGNPDMEWLEDALCHGLHAHLWFPPLESPTPGNYYEVGKKVCFRCPVWKECLDEATRNGEVWGMWGGLTPQERRGTTRVAHGTVEKSRLGCICIDCKRTTWRIYNDLDLDKLPKSSEEFDISKLIFVLSDD